MTSNTASVTGLWNYLVRGGIAPAIALFGWLVALGFALRVAPDEGAYKVVATGLIHGRWPYEDLFINRQPLMFFWYLPAGLGWSIAAERVLAAAMIAASVPVVARLATRWSGEAHSSMAALVYSLFLANPLMPLRANTEAFLLLPLVGAIAAPSPAFAGALFGIAVMTKLHALVFAPVLIVIWKRESHIVLIAAAAVCAIVSAPFILIWRDYWDANISFLLAYGRYTADDRLASLTAVNELLIVATLPLWLAAVVGVVRCRNARLLVWATCGVVSIKASGFDYDHYYALLIPPLALLAPDGLVYLGRRPRVRLVLVASGAIAVLLWSLASYVLLGPKSPGPYEVLSAAAAAKPGELYVLGDRSEVYTYARRQPERRFFSSIPLVMRTDWGDEARSDLLACPPAVFVVPSSEHFTVTWTGDVERLYATREDYVAGSIFTNPSTTCTVAQ